MTRPESLYEAASYDLNKFRERRLAERRTTPRGSSDRRVNRAPNQTDQTVGPAQTEPNQEMK